jgi:3-mercaptopyruvate sulfurtransferase SseA
MRPPSSGLPALDVGRAAPHALDHRLTGWPARPIPTTRGSATSPARSLAAREHLGPEGRLQDVDALRARFAAVGIEPGAAVISYCGSGVTACHNLLVMEHAGLGQGRLFPGSWSQRSRDPERPVET